jgi:[NiFe] hydrogenase assembly HybE family chaperone
MTDSVVIAGRLQRVFRRIRRERMGTLPMLNPALGVRCVGFRPWRGHHLGVLITPWFLNLVLLPGEPDAWNGLHVGEKRLHAFPSGPYEFIVGRENGIGRFQMCSLFSPVREFADQTAAVAVAEAVLQGLMDGEVHDGTSMREREIERIWRGEADLEQKPETEEFDGTLEPLAAEPLLARTISRRELLRGRFSGGT